MHSRRCCWRPFSQELFFGSASFHYFLGRSGRISLVDFSRTQTWIGIASLLSLVMFHWILPIVPLLLRATHRTFGGLLLAPFVTSGLTVLPVATIFGFAFPLVVALFAGTSRSGDSSSAIVGRAYAANTVGSPFRISGRRLLAGAVSWKSSSSRRNRWREFTVGRRDFKASDSSVRIQSPLHRCRCPRGVVFLFV